MLAQFLEIGPVVQVTKGFRGPMILVRMCIDDEHVAARAHHTTQFFKDGSRTYDVVQEHMAHRDIHGIRREGELLGHPLAEGDMLVPGLGHLLPGSCEHGRCAIHADHVAHKRSHHACEVARACSGIKDCHVLVPGKEPAEAFLEFGLVGARDVVIPGRGDALKIVSFVRFDVLQLLLWRSRQIEADQGIEVLKDLFVGGQKVLEPPSQVLSLQKFARPP